MNVDKISENIREWFRKDSPDAMIIRLDVSLAKGGGFKVTLECKNATDEEE